MSSPSKHRSILSPKHSNRSNISPKKHKIENPFNPGIKLSINKCAKSSPSPKKPKSNFTIYEDKMPHSSPISLNEPTSNKLNHNDQENILQPKNIVNKSTNRVPLANLSINDYPGYVSYNQKVAVQLTELYQAINSNNEFNSLHKYSNLPNYLTPPRNSRHKYLVFSDTNDDLESEMIKKPDLIKHRRSLSVGKNDSKLKLIRKNNFNVLSN